MTNRLLKSDLFQLERSIIFKAVIIFDIIFGIWISIIAHSFILKGELFSFLRYTISSDSSNGYDYYNMSLNGSALVFLFFICSALCITIAQNSLKNQLSYYQKRNYIFISHALFFAICFLIAGSISIVTISISGYCITGNFFISSAPEMISKTFLFLLICVLDSSCIVCLFHVFKKSSLAIAAYPIFNISISLMLGIIDSASFYSDKSSNFLDSIKYIATFNSYKEISDPYLTYATGSQIAVISVSLIVLYYSIGYYNFSKREVR